MQITVTSTSGYTTERNVPDNGRRVRSGGNINSPAVRSKTAKGKNPRSVAGDETSGQAVNPRGQRGVCLSRVDVASAATERKTAWAKLCLTAKASRLRCG
jgi:hypothetical protein